MLIYHGREDILFLRMFLPLLLAFAFLFWLNFYLIAFNFNSLQIYLKITIKYKISFEKM